MSHLNSIKDVVATKSVRLLLTYMLGMVLVILPTHIFFYKSVPCDFMSIIQYLGNGMSNDHLWYLNVLFFIMVIAFPVCKLSVKIKPMNVLALAFLMIMFDYFTRLPRYSLQMKYSYYFMLGFAFPNIFNSLLNKCKQNRQQRLLLDILFVFLTVLVVLAQIRIQSSFETYYGAWMLHAHQKEYLFVSSITVIWMYLLLEYILRKSFVHNISNSRIVCLIDRYSLFIYVGHILICKVISAFLINPWVSLLPQTALVNAIGRVLTVFAMVFGPIGVKILLDLCAAQLSKIYHMILGDNFTHTKA